MKYHAHIYWKNPQEKTEALSTRIYLEKNGCLLGRVWDQPKGPHPLPMFQVKYNSNNKNKVENYLKNKNLTILLHEDIGEDDVRDHTEGARWIGKPLPLDLEILKDKK